MDGEKPTATVTASDRGTTEVNVLPCYTTCTKCGFTKHINRFSTPDVCRVCDKFDLETYFLDACSEGISEFRLVAHITPNGKAEFYIHPYGKSGNTMDFEVSGNILVGKK